MKTSSRFSFPFSSRTHTPFRPGFGLSSSSSLSSSPSFWLMAGFLAAASRLQAAPEFLVPPASPQLGAVAQTVTALTPHSKTAVLPEKPGAVFIDVFQISDRSNLKDATELDMDVEGSCEPATGFFYASPFVASTYDQIRDEMQKLDAGTRVYLRARLPENHLLGFSPGARYEYFNVTGDDPQDILAPTSNDVGKLDAWKKWRLEKADAGILSLLSVAEQKNLPVSLVVDPKWLIADSDAHAMTVEDWPTWFHSKAVDEIVLDSEWEKPQNLPLIAQAQNALKGSKIKVEAALDLRRGDKAIDPLGQIISLQGQGLDGIVLRAQTDADLLRGQAFLKDTLPEFPFGK